jgi:hypothetical protein
VPRPHAEPEADIAYPGKHLLELARIRPIVGAMSDEEEKAELLEEGHTVILRKESANARE